MLTLKKFKLIFYFLLFLFGFHALAIDYSTPLGYWNILDSVTKAPSALVLVYKNTDGTLAGKVLHIYKFSKKEPNGICTMCDGHLKNQTMINMNIVGGLKLIKPMLWGEGYILDPDDGKIYSLQITLSKDGQYLNLRGYIFKPTFGKTQQWRRAS
jgi:uncharacterized protein (DUF2147 family)